MKSLAAVAVLALAAGLADARRDARQADVHPIEKVVNMLGGLKMKVEFESKKEALLYEKYQKWCQDSEKTLSKAIKGEEEAISMLQSEVSAKTEQEAILKQEIDGLRQTLTDLASADAKATGNREKAANLYKQVSQDSKSTITAFKSAIKELIAAKGSSASMLQVLGRDQVREALALAEAYTADEEQRGILLELRNATNYTNKPRPNLKASGDYSGHIHKYRYKSNSVIELLKGLQAKFEDDLLTATKEETNSINAFDLAKQARGGEVAAAGTAKSQKISTLSSVQQDLAQDKADLKNQQEDYAADAGTLKSTEQSCEVKTREWDERSKVRSQEMEAMDVAVEILGKASGVRTAAPASPTSPTGPVAAANPSPTDDANQATASFLSTEVRGSRRTPVFVHRHYETAADSSATPSWSEQSARQGSLSFLQTSEDPRQRAVQLLRKAAVTTHSRVLERLAQELSIAQGAAFDQVINMVQKMIYRLEDEQRDEDKHKMWCDQEIMKTNTSKSDKEDKIEELRLRIEKGKGKAQQLTMETKAAQDMLAQIAGFVAEATEIRQVGKQENAEALKDAQQAQDAIAQATSVLETFYKDTGMVAKESWEFVQAPVQLPSEPSTWAASYTGVADPKSQPAGIVAVLQRIGSEFAAMEADTRAQEQTDQQDFEEQMKESKIETARRTQEVEMKTQEKKRLAESLDELAKSRKHLLAELEAVNQYLKDLEPACVAGDSTYEDRKSSRSEEILALKMTAEILGDAFKEQEQNQTGGNGTNFLGWRL